MPIRAGQTYLYPLDDTRTEHLWIIATEPDADGRFATASLTSLKGAKDQTVTLSKNDGHPFIKWDSCILYALAEITTIETLQGYLDCGSAKMQQSVRADILKLVVDGFIASDFTKNRVREFVKEYKRAAQNRPGQS